MFWNQGGNFGFAANLIFVYRLYPHSVEVLIAYISLKLKWCFNRFKFLSSQVLAQRIISTDFSFWSHPFESSMMPGLLKVCFYCQSESSFVSVAIRHSIRHPAGILASKFASSADSNDSISIFNALSRFHLVHVISHQCHHSMDVFLRARFLYWQQSID